MQWFEDNHQYTGRSAIPTQLKYDKLALVRVYDQGVTQPGWGAKDFMRNYLNGQFLPGRSTRPYEVSDAPFAIVMRSLPYVCIDIDGKNGGIETARVLSLPYTLAERSKSGNGYHLFYELPLTEWHPERGYDEISDIIGLLPGIDIKGTGVVYHYSTQRWNDVAVTELPESLFELLARARDIRRVSRVNRGGANSLSEDELLIVHDEIRERFKAPLRVGSRNQELYKLGAAAHGARLPDWVRLVEAAGEGVELSRDEVHHIIANIHRYT